MSPRGSIDTGSGEAQGWDELARSAQTNTIAGEELTELRQLLTFEVDSTPYAIPVERVREIVRIRPITPVPRVSESSSPW